MMKRVATFLLLLVSVTALGQEGSENLKLGTSTHTVLTPAWMTSGADKLYYVSSVGIMSPVTIGANMSFVGGTLSSSGGGAVSSVFGRTGAVVAAANDYSFSQLASIPTTLAGYGITDAAHSGANADIFSLSALNAVNTNTQNNLGATLPSIGTTTGVALLLTNTTAATGGVSIQVPPVIQWIGQGFFTVSQTDTWQAGFIPGSNSSIFKLQSSINSGAFTDAMTLTDNGNLSAAGNMIAGGSQQVAANGVFSWSGRAVMTSPADGTIALQNNALTGFTGLDLGGTSSNATQLKFQPFNAFAVVTGTGGGGWSDPNTATSGVLPNRYVLGVAPSGVSFSSTNTGVTDTVASTLYIGGAPTASTNTTIGTSYALNVNTGLTRLGGGLTLGGSTSGNTILSAEAIAGAGTATLPTTGKISSNIAVITATVDQTATAEQAHLTYTVPAGTVTVGATFTVYAWGNMDNGTTAITFTPRLRWNGLAGVVLMATPTVVGTTTALTNKTWSYEGSFTLTAIGGAGTARASAKLNNHTASSAGAFSTDEDNSGATDIAGIATGANRDIVLTWTLSATTGTPHVRTLGGWVEMVRN